MTERTSLWEARRMTLWRDIYEPNHWVLQVGLMCLHWYRGRGRKHFYRTVLDGIDPYLNYPDDPEFKAVLGRG